MSRGRLDRAYLPGEATQALAQGAFRVPSPCPPRGHQPEQFVAEGRLIIGGRRGCIHLDTDRRSLSEELRSQSERGHVLADTVQHARALALLRRLGGVPVHEHFLRCARHRVAEDVRMAAHHLVRESAGDIIEVEGARAGGNLRMEENLPEEVTEFFPQILGRTRLDGVDDLRGFLDQIGDEVAVTDLLRPDTSITNMTHCVGSHAQGVGCGVIWGSHAVTIRGARPRHLGVTPAH